MFSITSSSWKPAIGIYKILNLSHSPSSHEVGKVPSMEEERVKRKINEEIRREKEKQTKTENSKKASR